MYLGFVAMMAVAAAPSVSAELTAVAVEIVRAQELPYVVTVRVPEPWGTNGTVNAMTSVQGRQVTIWVSPILVNELDAYGIRGLLAHELAHARVGCGPKYRTPAQAMACEHKADALSARWVGRATALRTLCQVMPISFNWRYRTDASFTIERIRLLHNRTEIP